MLRPCILLIYFFFNLNSRREYILNNMKNSQPKKNEFKRDIHVIWDDVVLISYLSRLCGVQHFLDQKQEVLKKYQTIYTEG